MRRLVICLGIALVALIVASQFLLPPFLESQVADRITAHGGTASVDLAAVPAARLLWKHGRKLGIDARGLSVDLQSGQTDVFKVLDGFRDVNVFVADSRAGPFTISRFRVTSTGNHTYDLAIAGSGTASDVARYAGSRLAGGLGQALAGLAASAIDGFNTPIPFDAHMRIDTSSGQPVAENVSGEVAQFPAGPLAEVVANALLSGL